MTARRNPQQAEPTTASADMGTGAAGRVIPTSSVVMGIVVRVAGTVPVRLDLSHAGTPQRQLGMAAGAVLLYLRSAVTARAVAEQWAQAATHARCLAAAVVGRRPAVVGPSTISALVRLAGIPEVTAAVQPARPGGSDPTLLRLGVGPVTWEICDAVAYTTLLRAWRQATRLLDDTLNDDTGDEGNE